MKANKGDTAATVTTNDKGQWQTPELYLSEYQVIEVSAPEGYILDTRPIPFSLTYAGQEVELASTSLTATNDFQSLDIQLFKNEESIVAWENNQPVIENIKADGKVFGVFTRHDMTVADGTVPQDFLLAVTTVTNGVATFELQLPQETYYLKELDAGDSHALILKEYEFTFTAENNHATFPIHLYEGVVSIDNETLQKIAHAPILNKLHLRKLTNKPSLIKKQVWNLIMTN